jgi:hypothetical protein
MGVGLHFWQVDGGDYSRDLTNRILRQPGLKGGSEL